MLKEGLLMIEDFTKEDFLEGTSPYEFVSAYKQDPFEHDRILEKVTEQASKVGVRAFKRLYDKYRKSLTLTTAQMVGNVADYDYKGLPVALNTGKWLAGEHGIYTMTNQGEMVACPHPIIPVERLYNIDEATEKIKLAYRPGKHWREITVDKSVVSSSNSIVKLSDFGISVTSETARALVSYLQEVEMLNYERITESRSVARLGWVNDQEFSPYVKDLIFDGDAQFRALFESVTEKGSLKEWLQIASGVRRTSITGRIVLAASFASALVGPCGASPFFVHLWGTESGTGKTVALMVAASVWANPEIGRFVQTFNSTAVSRERTAVFLNSLPMIIDELQLSKDKRGNSDFNVYFLAQGTGRGRGLKSGGIETIGSWRNCMITSGETPLIKSGDGAGAINRVIDIEVKSGPVIEDGHKTAGAVRENHGHAGKVLVDYLLQEGNIEKARQRYGEFFRELIQHDTTEKQAMAAAIILTADEITNELLFRDWDYQLTVQEVSKFLASHSEVSTVERGYEYLVGWVSENAARFKPDQNQGNFGVLEDDKAYIISNVFTKACEEGGFNRQALLSGLVSAGYVEGDKGRNTTTKRIDGVKTRCVVLQLLQDYEEQFIV